MVSHLRQVPVGSDLMDVIILSGVLHNPFVDVVIKQMSDNM